jgi:5-methylcytosine-specific restriction endonuclease McrA
MEEADVLGFTERLLSLIDTTRYSATYKLATLIALMDLAQEHCEPSGSGPQTLSGLEVGRRVVAMYWPQTAPYAAGAHGSAVLAQSRSNDIPSKLAAWRQQHGVPAGATFDDAGKPDPAGWKKLSDELAAIVVGMPLAKLQRFGTGQGSVEDRFIYDFGWPDEVKANVVLRDSFDDTITFRPGVAGVLVRLAPLLRPLVQARWADQVAAKNTDVVDAHQLSEFLFGASRISLDPVRVPLVEMQEGKCFYCHKPLGKSPAVDHFLPWSRHPDNTLDNLVAADPGCNGSKSASLAGVEHLEGWRERFDPSSQAHALLDKIVYDTGWPRRPERTLASARASYLWLPPAARLWQSASLLEPVDTARVRAALGVTSD